MAIVDERTPQLSSCPVMDGGRRQCRKRGKEDRRERKGRRGRGGEGWGGRRGGALLSSAVPLEPLAALMQLSCPVYRHILIVLPPNRHVIPAHARQHQNLTEECRSRRIHYGTH